MHNLGKNVRKMQHKWSALHLFLRVNDGYLTRT